MNVLNFNSINSNEVNKKPYLYMVINDCIKKSNLSDVIQHFPCISYPGSIPVNKNELTGSFGQLINNLESDKLRKIISNKFSIDLIDRPIITTLRGVIRKKDGRIHTDSKTKLITVLLYLNENWQSKDAHLRILNNGKNIDDYIEEIPPIAGTMVIFKVTNNCWHGHTPMQGKRLSIQMNYLVSEHSKNKHSFFHNISKHIKKLKKMIIKLPNKSFHLIANASAEFKR